MSDQVLDLGCLPEVTAALAAGAEENDRTGSFPAAGIKAVHAAGLLTATIAERHGGPSTGLAQTAAILHALGRGNPSVALITAMTLLSSRAGTAGDMACGAARRGGRGIGVAARPDQCAARGARARTPARGGLPATTARGREAGP